MNHVGHGPSVRHQNGGGEKQDGEENPGLQEVGLLRVDFAQVPSRFIPQDEGTTQLDPGVFERQCMEDESVEEHR